MASERQGAGTLFENPLSRCAGSQTFGLCFPSFFELTPHSGKGRKFFEKSFGKKLCARVSLTPLYCRPCSRPPRSQSYPGSAAAGSSSPPPRPRSAACCRTRCTSPGRPPGRGWASPHWPHGGCPVPGRRAAACPRRWWRAAAPQAAAAGQWTAAARSAPRCRWGSPGRACPFGLKRGRCPPCGAQTP